MAFDFDAGKYAAYLWPALGIVVLVLGLLTADTLARARRWRREAERLQAERDGQSR